MLLAFTADDYVATDDDAGDGATDVEAVLLPPADAWIVAITYAVEGADKDAFCLPAARR